MNMRNLLFYKITQGEMFNFSFARKYAYSNIRYCKILGCPKVQDMLRKYRNLDVDGALGLGFNISRKGASWGKAVIRPN